jgi:hypothetical protein
MPKERNGRAYPKIEAKGGGMREIPHATHRSRRLPND